MEATCSTRCARSGCARSTEGSSTVLTTCRNAVVDSCLRRNDKKAKRNDAASVNKNFRFEISKEEPRHCPEKPFDCAQDKTGRSGGGKYKRKDPPNKFGG